MSQKSMLRRLLIAFLLFGCLAGRAVSAEDKEAKLIKATAYDAGYDLADSNYHSITLGSDGRIYYTMSSHRIDVHFRFCCYDPKLDKIVFVKDLGDAADEDSTKFVPQGKCHAPLFEKDKKIYFATHIGYYQKNRHGRGKYLGFHIMYYDMQADKFVDLVRGPEEEGLITAIMDKGRMMFYGLTWPGNQFCVYDITKNKLTNYGYPFGGGVKTDGEDGTKSVERVVCRTLPLHPDGTVYGTNMEGQIFSFNPDNPTVEVLEGVNLSQGAVQPVDKAGAKNNNWREILWDDRDQCFYGIHHGTQSLFKFDPKMKEIKPVTRLRAKAFQDSPGAPRSSQLGFTMGPDHTLYYLVHGPQLPIGDRRRVHQNVYLVTYNLDTGKYIDHGPVICQDERRLIFTESIQVCPNGDIYSVGWVEVWEPKEHERFRALRTLGNPVETSGAVYQIMLVRIPKDQYSMD